LFGGVAGDRHNPLIVPLMGAGGLTANHP